MDAGRCTYSENYYAWKGYNISLEYLVNATALKQYIKAYAPLWEEFQIRNVSVNCEMTVTGKNSQYPMMSILGIDPDGGDEVGDPDNIRVLPT